MENGSAITTQGLGGSGTALCRQFISGCCRFGPSCHFSHELPVLKSPQICKYFQKGGCWFGERCRYQHILQPDGRAPASRRGSAPALQPAWGGTMFQNRRGSEPTIAQAQGGYARSRRGSEPLMASLASLQHGFERLSIGIAEEEEQAAAEAVPLRLQPQESECLGSHMRRGPLASHTAAPLYGSGAASSSALAPCPPVVRVGVVTVVQESGSGAGTPCSLECSSQQGACPSGAEAPPSRIQAAGSAGEAYERSKDVTCGICMDKVFEKPTAQERRFGILPNCSHAFCLGCIVTWRKTKDFQDEVIKSCPQCRVMSSYYIPNKYWVSDGDQKAALVASFKEKCSKIRCSFFMRHGCCPFKSECIYLHEFPRGYRPRRRRRSSNLPYRMSLDDAHSHGLQLQLQYVIAMALLDDHDDDDMLEGYFELLMDDSDSY
ncbi:makorin, ring finger protein, 4 isoform X2 [Amia ocellicauda]|uniref:makorin, ring finger protein, 4 isoform X2 n=1 Tax=Amia ocellicauda TaxID=2972642 RepID=UPI003464CE23